MPDPQQSPNQNPQSVPPQNSTPSPAVARPTSASASTPPPAPQDPSVQLNVPQKEVSQPEGSDDLSSLSPFEVLKKKQIKPSIVPSNLEDAPADSSSVNAAPTPSKSREELLQQASKAEDSPFILPKSDVSPNTPAPVANFSIPVNQGTAGVPAPTPSTAHPLATTPPAVPNATAPQQRPVPPATPTSVPRKKSNSSLWFILAGVGALVLLSGSAYVLALGGTRVPVLYTALSGLSGDGLKLAEQSLATIAGQQGYYQLGELSVAPDNDTEKPEVPGSEDELLEDNFASSQPITTFASKTTAGEPLHYTVADQRLLGKMAVSNERVVDEVPVYVSETTNWEMYFPANEITSHVTIDQSEVKQSLLYPVLRPISLPEILSSVSEVQGYQKGKINNNPAATHVYAVRPEGLVSILPEEAQVQAAQAVVSYAWGTSLPVQSKLTVIFNYQDTTYRLMQEWQYPTWNESLAESTELNALTAELSEPESISIMDLASYLGISQLADVPNTLPEGALAAVDPIVPTGKTISQATTPIAAVPPIPVQPASAEAQQRDTQRLLDLEDLKMALTNYAAANEGKYPVSEGIEQSRSSATLFSSLVPQYLTAMSVDPLTDTHWYEYKSDGDSYYLRSVAEDASNAKAKQGKTFYYYELTN